MELQLELGRGGEISLVRSGDVEIEVPSWWASLPSDVIQEVLTCKQAKQMIVSVGRHGDVITFLTGVGAVMELSTTRFDLPEGDVEPIDYGHTVAILLHGGGTYEMAADWLIESATVLVHA